MKHNKTKLKFISIMILAIIAIVGIIAVAIKSSDIYAADPTYTDSGVTYTLSKTTLKITGSGTVTNKWKNSSQLGTSLPTTITSVTIANTITGIEDSAFEGCTALTKVTFNKDSTCTSIGKNAFKGCTALKNIYNSTTGGIIPKSVVTIGSGAFSGCTSMTTLKFAKDSGCTSIGDNAFEGCTALTTFVIPDNVTTIESNTFKGCTALETLTVGTGVTTIEKGAFKDVPLTKKLQYNPINCTNYNNVFTGKQIETIKIGDKVEVIPNNFIKGNRKIKKIILPASVKEIKADAFNNATINNGIWIRNRNCEVETTSTISNYTSVFVELPAQKDYSSFTGVDSNGTKFSTLLKWLNENNKRYMPFATTNETDNVSGTQSTIGANGSLKNYTSFINDYRFKNTNKSRKWIFALSNGGGTSYSVVNNGDFGLLGNKFFYFPITFSHRANCGMDTGIGESTNSFYAYAGGSYDFFCMVGGCNHQRWEGKVQVLNASRNCNWYIFD